MKLLFLLSFFISTAISAECPSCNGAKSIQCDACSDGSVNCAAGCVQLDMGKRKDKPQKSGWVLVVYTNEKGKVVRTSCSKGHIGEVWHGEPGTIKPQGKCSACNGTTKVQCAKCSGTGATPCSTCHGTGALSTAELSAYNAAAQQTAIENGFQLNDGSIVNGKFFGQNGDTITIKTDDGQWLQINTSEIKSVPIALKDRIKLPAPN